MYTIRNIYLKGISESDPVVRSGGDHMREKQNGKLVRWALISTAVCVLMVGAIVNVPGVTANAGGCYVDVSGTVGQYTSICGRQTSTDPVTYQVWISYGVSTQYGYRMKVATTQDMDPIYGDWTRSQPDTDSIYNGRYTSIAVDGSNHLYISSQRSSNAFPFPNYLRYSYYDGSSWSFSDLDTSYTNSGYYTSIAIDSSGNVHISYMDHANDDLRYEYKPSGGSWANAVLVDGIDNVNVGWESHIALDSGGYPHISYYDSSNTALKHAYKDANGWHTETVDDPANTDVGHYSSITIDGSNNIYIAYYDTTNTNLKYAYKASGGAWTTTNVDTTNTVGQYTDIALSSTKVYISYYYVTGGDCKYAYKTFAGGWSTAACGFNQSNDIGQYTSCVYLNSHIRISQYEVTETNLVCTYQD